MSNGMSSIIHLRISGPILTTISAVRIRFPTRRITLHELPIGRILDGRAILTRIDLAVDGIITGGSAQSILRPTLADMTQVLLHVQMAVGQA